MESSLGFMVCTVAFGLSRVMNVNLARYGIALVVVLNAILFPRSWALECLLLFGCLIFLLTSFNLLYMLLAALIFLGTSIALKSGVRQSVLAHIKECLAENAPVDNPSSTNIQMIELSMRSNSGIPKTLLGDAHLRGHLPLSRIAEFNMNLLRAGGIVGSDSFTLMSDIWPTSEEGSPRFSVRVPLSEFECVVFPPFWAQIAQIVIFLCIGYAIYDHTLKISYLTVLSNRYLEGAMVSFSSLEVRERVVCQLAEDEIAYFNTAINSSRYRDSHVANRRIPRDDDSWTSETSDCYKAPFAGLGEDPSDPTALGRLGDALDGIANSDFKGKAPPISPDPSVAANKAKRDDVPPAIAPFVACCHQIYSETSLLANLQKYLAYHVRRDLTPMYPIFTDYLQPASESQHNHQSQSLSSVGEEFYISNSATQEHTPIESSYISFPSSQQPHQRPPEASIPPMRTSLSHFPLFQFFAQATSTCILQNLHHYTGPKPNPQRDPYDSAAQLRTYNCRHMPSNDVSILPRQDIYDRDQSILGGVSSSPDTAAQTPGTVDFYNITSTPDNKSCLTPGAVTPEPKSPAQSSGPLNLKSDFLQMHPFELLLIDCVANTLNSRQIESQMPLPDPLGANTTMTRRCQRLLTTANVSELADIIGQGYVTNNLSKSNEYGEGTSSNHLEPFHVGLTRISTMGQSRFRGRRQSGSGAFTSRGDQYSRRRLSLPVARRNPPYDSNQTYQGYKDATNQTVYHNPMRAEDPSYENRFTSSHEESTSFSDMASSDDSIGLYSGGDEDDLLLHFVTTDAASAYRSRAAVTCIKLEKVFGPMIAAATHFFADTCHKFIDRVIKIVDDFVTSRALIMFIASYPRDISSPERNRLGSYVDLTVERWYCEWLQSYVLRHWRVSEISFISCLQVIHIIVEGIQLYISGPLALQLKAVDWQPSKLPSAQDFLNNGYFDLMLDNPGQKVNVEKVRTLIVLYCCSRILAQVSINVSVAQCFWRRNTRRKIASTSRALFFMAIFHLVLAELDYAVFAHVMDQYRAIGHSCVSTTIYATLITVPLLTPNARLPSLVILYGATFAIHAITMGFLFTALQDYLSILGTWLAFAMFGLGLVDWSFDRARRSIFCRSVLPHMIIVDGAYHWAMNLYDDQKRVEHNKNKSGESFSDGRISRQRTSIIIDGDHDTDPTSSEAEAAVMWARQEMTPLGSDHDSTEICRNILWVRTGSSDNTSKSSNNSWEDEESEPSDTPRVVATSSSVNSGNCSGDGETFARLRLGVSDDDAITSPDMMNNQIILEDADCSIFNPPLSRLWSNNLFTPVGPAVNSLDEPSRSAKSSVARLGPNFIRVGPAIRKRRTSTNSTGQSVSKYDIN